MTVAWSSSGLGPAPSAGTCTPIRPSAEAWGPVSALSRCGLVLVGGRGVPAPDSPVSLGPTGVDPGPCPSLWLLCGPRPAACRGPSARLCHWGSHSSVSAGADGCGRRRRGSRHHGPQHLLQDRGSLLCLHGGFTVCPHTQGGPVGQQEAMASSTRHWAAADLWAAVCEPVRNPLQGSGDRRGSLSTTCPPGLSWGLAQSGPCAAFGK